MHVLGYLRVSTQEQRESGAGLVAQRAAIEAVARARGWRVTWLEDAGYSGGTLERPAIAEGLRMLAAHEADGLVVAKLDRLSRSLVDFAGLMDRSRRERWALVALDLGVDTSTPSGEMVANVLASFAQYERRIIGQRTREALAVKRAQGVRLGRPPVLPAPLRSRIIRARRRGQTLQAIADRLTREGIPTAHGGRRWYASTVRSALRAA